jgi:cell fate regulator YaaT (PSP1 superfamily)
MVEVIGVKLKEKGQIYYFLPNNYVIKKNVTVIVETERGLQFGKVATDVIEIDESKIKTPLKKIIRIASKQDYRQHKNNLRDAREAIIKCRELVKKFELDMQVIDASFTFDRNQLMFYFVSDQRVDFRELAKALASIYKTRIELRQVGVRDRAKETGGIGLCGRCLCCSQFLCDFDSVSINMAKNQNLSLNPTKINGLCGRLLCCLKYEDECYSEYRKGLPDIGDKVETSERIGKVVSLDIIEGKYKVEVPDVGIIDMARDNNGSD